MQMATGQTPEKKGNFFSDYETIEDTIDGTIASIDIDDTKIAPAPTPGSGYKPSGVGDGVLFPLFEPKLEGGWQKYSRNAEGTPPSG